MIFVLSSVSYWAKDFLFYLTVFIKGSSRGIRYGDNKIRESKKVREGL